MAEAKFLTVNQITKYLQMNRMTIYKLAKAGKLPAVKIGNEWRFSKEELKKYLDAHVKKAAFQTQTKTAKKSGKGKVLVVDDDPGIRDLFERILKDDGQQVYLASSGREGIKLAKKYNPDVVLLDLKMADMHGIDVLRQIKNYNKGIAVVMITAYATMNTAIEAMKLGAMDYIAKPFDNDKVISLVRNAIQAPAHKLKS